MTTEIIEKLKTGKFVTLKCSSLFKKAILEITDSSGNVIFTESFETGHLDIGFAQILMLQKAGEYSNKGYYCKINPFTN